MPGSGPTNADIGLLQAYAESSFAADMSGSLGSFLSIPFQEGSATFTCGQEMLDPMHAVQHQHDYREEILGKKSCQVSFTMPLAPTGTLAGDATTAVQSALGLLLKTCMGGEDLGTGSTASGAWSSAKSGAVTDAGGIEKGSALGWVNTAGALECRPVGNKATNTLTTKLGFSATPADESTIYSSATYYLTQDPDASLNFAIRGLESNDEWLLMGCQLDSIAIDLSFDGVPTVQFGFKGANWLHGDDAAGTFSDIAPVTYANTSPISGHAGRLMVRTTDTQSYTAGVTIAANALAFEPQLSYAAVPSPSGTNGVLRWRLSRASGPSVQGSFGTYFESQRWHDHRDAKDDLLVLYQVGTVPANGAVLIEASTCQIVDAQIEGSGTQNVNATWKARLDSTVSTGTTDLHLSPLRIHFF